MRDCGCPGVEKYVLWSGVEVFHTGNGEDRHPADRQRMKPLRFTDRFRTFTTSPCVYRNRRRLTPFFSFSVVRRIGRGLRISRARRKSSSRPISRRELEGASEAGLASVVLNMADSPVYDQLTQAVLEAVADDILAPGSCVVALYSGFDADAMDSISVINLGEHLDRLTGRDLRQLETRVPLDTLKLVVDLAVEIGREGREGKPVGTIFVVGDTRKVLACSRSVGFDPVRGYSRKDGTCNDPRVREGIKEIAQMDGAIIVSADGTVRQPAATSTRQLLRSLSPRGWDLATGPPPESARDQGRGRDRQPVQRHGPHLQNGEVMLRIEPIHRRPMVWKDFEYEPPTAESRSRRSVDGGKSGSARGANPPAVPSRAPPQAGGRDQPT